MYKMLIVDDEYIVRRGLKETIDWPKYGITIIGEASNGVKGLELVKELKPDIVITDIKMPLMDGLELVKEIKKMEIDCEVLILSGYKDFEYSKATLEKGALSYLLKPIDNNELIEKVLETANKIVEKRRLKRLFEQVEQDKPVLEKSIIRQLIHGEYDHINDIKSKIQTYNMNIPNNGNVIYVCIDNIDIVKSKDELRKVCDDLAEKFTRVFLEYNKHFSLLFVNEGTFVFIIEKTIEKKLNELLEKILIKYEREHKEPVSIGVGITYEELEKVDKSYNTALVATQQKLFLALNTINFYQDDVKRYKTVVYEVMDYISKNYRYNMTVKEVADSIYVSESYLQHTLKDNIGKTFNECLTDYRIIIAKRMLLEKNIRVYEVAEAVGYNDVKYFSQIFKKKTGMTPSEFVNR